MNKPRATAEGGVDLIIIFFSNPRKKKISDTIVVEQEKVPPNTTLGYVYSGRYHLISQTSLMIAVSRNYIQDWSRETHVPLNMIVPCWSERFQEPVIGTP